LLWCICNTQKNDPILIHGLCHICKRPLAQSDPRKDDIEIVADENLAYRDLVLV